MSYEQSVKQQKALKDLISKDSDLLDFIGEDFDPMENWEPPEEEIKKKKDTFYHSSEDLQDLRKNTDVGLVDEDWISSGSFLLNEDEVPDWAKDYVFETLAMSKYTDSSLGGNIAINMPYGFTRYADIRPAKFDKKEKKMVPQSAIPRNLVSAGGLETNIGMGRYYSEAIDDTSHLIYLQFGVPRFNGLLDYFFRAIDRQDVIVANRGYKSRAYEAGLALGGITLFLAFPILSSMLFIGKTLLKIAGFFNTFDYYYMEPTMALYYGSVNQLVTRIATEMGILIPSFMKEPEIKAVGYPVKLDKEQFENIKKLMPNIINPTTNYIDIYAVATRVQALNALRLEAEQKRAEDAEKGIIDIISDWTQDTLIGFSKGIAETAAKFIDRNFWFEDFLENQRNTGVWDKPVEEQEKEIEEMNKEKEKPKLEATVQTKDGGYMYEDVIAQVEKEGQWTRFTKSLSAAFKDGGAYVVFHVNAQRNVTTTFNNSYKDIGIGNTINSVGGAARDFKFNIAGGNIAGETLDSIVKGVSDFALGALDSFSGGISNVAATFFGNAFVNMPKHWDNSTTNLPGLQFSLKLRTPYGTVFDRLQSVMIPLSLLLAGVLPKATGPSSYTSPFLCSCFARGVRNIKLGMITDFSVTTGVGSVAYTRDRQPINMDVSFTITDFAPMMTVPITSSIFDTFRVSLDDNSSFSRFISTLCGRSIFTNKYKANKLKIGASMALMEVSRSLSPDALGMSFGYALNNSILGGLAAAQNLHVNENK